MKIREEINEIKTKTQYKRSIKKVFFKDDKS